MLRPSQKRWILLREKVQKNKFCCVVKQAITLIFGLKLDAKSWYSQEILRGVNFWNGSGILFDLYLSESHKWQKGFSKHQISGSLSKIVKRASKLPVLTFDTRPTCFYLRKFQAKNKTAASRLMVGGAVASWLVRFRFEWSRFEPWPWTLCCVLGKDTLLAQCLSSPRITNEYRRI